MTTAQLNSEIIGRENGHRKLIISSINLASSDLVNTPVVQSSQPVTYRQIESMGQGGQGVMEDIERENVVSGISTRLTLVKRMCGDQV